MEAFRFPTVVIVAFVILAGCVSKPGVPDASPPNASDEPGRSASTPTPTQPPTTPSASAPPKLEAPRKISPGPSAEVSGTSVTLIWDEPVHSEGDLTYRVFMDGQVLASCSGKATSCRVSGLIAGTTYSWAVEATLRAPGWDPISEQDWSWHFRTKAAPSPSGGETVSTSPAFRLVAPANGAVTGPNPPWEWTSNGPGYTYTIHFRERYDQGETAANCGAALSAAGCDYKPNLDPWTYEWWVVASDGTHATTSETWTFRAAAE